MNTGNFNNAFTAVFVEEKPQQTHSNKIYIVGEEQFKWLALLICPCGCGELIHLNLLKETRPCWRIFIHKNQRVTLKPSIWRIRGCESHFIIKKGIVYPVIDDNNE